MIKIPIPPLKVAPSHISREDIETIAGMAVGEDLTLYQRAFVHKSIESAARRDPASPEYTTESNETLEFVGDSILGAVVADYLYTTFPTKNEGFLTTARTKIVKSATLAGFAKALGMDRFLLMASKTVRAGGKTNKRFMEDAFEAFVAAVYYDKGFCGAREFLLRVIRTYFDHSALYRNDNYKDIMLRYSQSVKADMPEYNVVFEEGPSHKKKFVVELRLFGERQGKATGSTIKTAEQLAAKNSMKKLCIDPGF